MTKEYMLELVDVRIAVLDRRYTNACNNMDDKGEQALSKGSAAAVRTQSKRDIQLLLLVKELLTGYKGGCDLSEDALDGFYRIVEPVERHRWRTK